MARGNFGVTGKIELAQMAALAQLPQMVADMGGAGSFGACRGGMCVHGGKPITRISRLPLPRT
jgi:hypothetical protein